MDEFRPAGWLGNRHLQTLAAALPISLPSAQERVEIAVPEGGSLIARAWWQPSGRSARTLLLVHGVGGNADSSYVMRAALACHRAGCHVVRLNLRGAGEGVATASSIYHAGLTSDLDHAVRELSRHRRFASCASSGSRSAAASRSS